MGRHSTDDPLAADWRADRVGSARRGENPMVLARMRSGYAVLGDTQYLPGYCVLLADFGPPPVPLPRTPLEGASELGLAVDGKLGDAGDPRPDHLTDLNRVQRAEFLSDMGLLGEAVFAVCSGFDPSFRRVNYEIQGNFDRFLHAHVHPRYGWEPPDFVSGPVGRYPEDVLEASEHEAGDAHEALREALVAELERVMADAYGLPST